MVQSRTSAAIFLGCAILIGMTGCGRSGNGSNNGKSANTADSSVPTATEQKLVFFYSQFTNFVVMHIPADDFTSTQVLAAQNGPFEWWAFNQSNIGCAQSGYAANQTSHPLPFVDGYSVDGANLENTLEQAGVRTTQSYTLTLNPTPWGSISRSFSCLVNTDKMASLAQGQNFHGILAIPVGQRVCHRWTYVNRYQTTAPGQGAVQVFAGTFSYTMKPLVDGVQFPGQGTASVKVALNPDNGQRVVIDYQLHDPTISITGFSAPETASPSQDTCAGP